MLISITKTPAFYKAEEVLSYVTPEAVARYTEYWKTITPSDHAGAMKRWLFAYCSVHTTWATNVLAYQALSSAPASALADRDSVDALLRPSKCGLWKTRSRGISEFVRSFLDDPSAWYPKKRESHADARDRMVASLHGLGHAKTSFALEMLDPTGADVFCMDTHALQWYGLAGDAKLTPDTYRSIESHWVGRCRERGVPPAIARHVAWDARQGRSLSSYWAHVFHSPDPKDRKRCRSTSARRSSSSPAPATPGRTARTSTRH